MKTTSFLKALTLSSIATFFLGFLTSCDGGDDPTPTEKKWVTAYQNITLGNQKNYTDGHFLKLKTGESVKLENVSGQQEYMAFMIFTDYGVNNTYLTFPANAADAATFKNELATNRLFVQPNVGLNNWATAKMTNGMIYKVTNISAADFSSLVSSKDWATFDTYFKKCNGGQELLSFKLNYDLEPTAGNLYLLQFNGLVRAIMYAKSYVKKADGSTAFTFDIVIESREFNAKLDLAKNLQP